MPISAAMLPEFDHEMANTRRTLERVPDSAFDWTPHEKSLSMQALVSHLANLPSWTAMTIEMPIALTSEATTALTSRSSRAKRGSITPWWRPLESRPPRAP